MNKNITIIIFLLFSLPLFSQQEPQYTQYMFNKLAYNPGFAGACTGICVGGLIRQQWVGFKDSDGEGGSYNVAPETYVISVNAPIRVLRGGLGLTLIQDKIGFQDNIYVNLIYAYQTTLGSGDLGIGLQLSLLNNKIDFSKYRPINGNDPLLTGKSEETDMIFDGGIGLYYRVPDTYYLGLSVLQLLGSKSSFDGTATKLARQINLVGGYQFTLPNSPAFDILPSIMIKTDFSSIQYDISALLRYNNKVWGGLSYRLQDAVSIILGMKYKNFTIGYSYDIPTSAIGSYGTHEVRVGYCFKIEIDKIKKIYRNTRFL